WLARVMEVRNLLQLSDGMIPTFNAAPGTVAPLWLRELAGPLALRRRRSRAAGGRRVFRCVRPVLWHAIRARVRETDRDLVLQEPLSRGCGPPWRQTARPLVATFLRPSRQVFRVPELHARAHRNRRCPTDRVAGRYAWRQPAQRLAVGPSERQRSHPSGRPATRALGTPYCHPHLPALPNRL